MDKLIIELYCPSYDKELSSYLLSQKGITKCDIDYDSKIISAKIIKQFIYLYLSIKIPTILSFEKKNISNYVSHTITIKDLCCEYCLMGTIEDLFETDGILSAKSNYDFNNKFNVKIDVSYDKKILSTTLH